MGRILNLDESYYYSWEEFVKDYPDAEEIWNKIRAEANHDMSQYDYKDKIIEVLEHYPELTFAHYEEIVDFITVHEVGLDKPDREAVTKEFLNKMRLYTLRNENSEGYEDGLGDVWAMILTDAPRDVFDNMVEEVKERCPDVDDDDYIEEHEQLDWMVDELYEKLVEEGYIVMDTPRIEGFVIMES